jgi:AraC-like DNA-binding protein
MLNLFSNACKFTSRGDVTLTVAVGEREVTVMVSDTGLGVPLAEQKMIFNEFHQSERTAARGYGGMGLGLAITRHLVELHGGKIGVLSSGVEGSGATFYFTLPVASEAEPAVPWGTADEDCKQTVLILSEQTTTGERLKAYLDERGFKVHHLEVDLKADPSHRWLSQVMACPCGAIVLDCDPDAEWGWQLMTALKNNPGTQDIPVIFCNMMPGRDRGAMLELDYLAKPLGLDALTGALEQHGIALQAHSASPSTISVQGSGRGTPETPPKVILVVDDEAGERHLLTRYVHERFPDVRVLEAGNGRQALEWMQKDRPSLVLLDLMMPDVDGFALIETMQADKALRGIPVVVMTAMSMTKDVVERLNRGVTSILGKGLFSAEETLAHIETALARNKRLGSEVQRIARTAMAYIHTNFAEPVTRGDIARHVGVNERYLTHCFHQEVGIAPMSYLLRYRIGRAKELLAESDRSITDIAMQVGFSSSSYLSHVFLKEVGVTPREYRQGKS